MILQCPACNARFLVPDTAIGMNGRTVRCGKCAHTWLATLPADTKLPDLDTMLGEIHAGPRPVPPGSNVPKVREEEVHGSIKFAAYALSAVAAALIAFFYYPHWFGYTPSHGMALADVLMSKTETGDEKNKRTIYEISGDIINTARIPKSVPNIRVTLVDSEGAKIKFWEFSGNKDRFLDPNEHIPFSTGEEINLAFTRGTHFIVDLGNNLELNLRRKP